MKDPKKVRTPDQHNVGRIIFFPSVQIMARFVNCYRDLFYRTVDTNKWNGYTFYCRKSVPGEGNNKPNVYFTINKKNWVNIEKALPLVRREGNRGRVWDYILAKED